MEEKDSESYPPSVTVSCDLFYIASGLSGSRRGLRPSDHLTGQQVPTTPTMTSSTPSRPPASGRRGQQSRSTQVSSLQCTDIVCCLLIHLHTQYFLCVLSREMELFVHVTVEMMSEKVRNIPLNMYYTCGKKVQ